MIQIHITLLAACPLIACLAVLFYPTSPARTKQLLAAVSLPFLIFGLASMLLLSAVGIPTIEWVCPGFCAGVVVLFCRSKRMTTCSYVAFLAIMIGLFANFFEIVHNGYTTDPVMTANLGLVQQQQLVDQGTEELELSQPEDGAYESGSLSKILKNDLHSHVNAVHVKNEWHTIFTRLFRIVDTSGVLVTTGGPPEQAILHLQVMTETAQ